MRATGRTRSHRHAAWTEHLLPAWVSQQRPITRPEPLNPNLAPTPLPHRRRPRRERDRHRLRRARHPAPAALPGRRRRAGGRARHRAAAAGRRGQLSAQHGLAVRTVRADAASTGLPSDSFDFVHERMLLLNVTSPQDIVAEMTRLARPGGVVALQEPRQRGLGNRPAASRLGATADRGQRRLPANRPGLPYRPPRRAPAP